MNIGAMVMIVSKPFHYRTWPGWVPEMDVLLGRTGRVIEIYEYAVRVEIDGTRWMYHIKWVEVIPPTNGHYDGNIHIGQELPP